jgi:hypothetical protein
MHADMADSGLLNISIRQSVDVRVLRLRAHVSQQAEAAATQSAMAKDNQVETDGTGYASIHTSRHRVVFARTQISSTDRFGMSTASVVARTTTSSSTAWLMQFHPQLNHQLFHRQLFHPQLNHQSSRHRLAAAEVAQTARLLAHAAEHAHRSKTDTFASDNVHKTNDLRKNAQLRTIMAKRRKQSLAVG